MTISQHSSAPILIVHTGGLGDLILVSRLVEGLIGHYPSRRIVLLVRQPFAQVPALFPKPPHEVLPLEFEPHRQTVPGEELKAKLRTLVRQVRDLGPSMVIAADLEPSWLSWFLLSVLPEAKLVGLTATEAPRGLLRVLAKEFGGEIRPLQSPLFEEGMHENTRYERLLSFLGAPVGAVVAWPKPQVDEALFREFSIEPGKYIACFPTGAASTLVKRWNPANYASVLKGQLSDSSRLLLTGDVSERAMLEEFKAAFGPDVKYLSVFTGAAQEVDKLASVLAHARLFFGNDTGPAHLAQAYGVPGVIVFGGGTWPHYAPWGKGSVGVVQPMGCFGCRWDCAFGQPYCLDNLPVEPVRQAFEKAARAVDAASVIEVPAPADRQPLLKIAGESHRRTVQESRSRVDAAMELQSDLLIPITVIEDIDAGQSLLQQTVNQQTEALQLVDRALRAFLPEAGVTVQGYEDLEGALTEKLSRDRHVKAEGENRLAQILQLNGMVETRDAENQHLQTQLTEAGGELRKQRECLEQVHAELHRVHDELHRVHNDLKQTQTQVEILTEGLAEARKQLTAAGEREQEALAAINMFKSETPFDFLKRWWGSRNANRR